MPRATDVVPGVKLVEGHQALRINLHFVRDVDRTELIEAWDKGFQNNAAGTTTELAASFETFKGTMADIEAGKQLGFLYTPSGWARNRRTQT